MKGAHLWKRILNEGVRIKEIEDTDLTGEDLASSIIRTTIIVDGKVDEGWQVELDDLGLPFRDFWIEGRQPDGTQWGAWLCAKPGYDAFWFVIAGMPAMQPWHVGSVMCKANDDGTIDPRSHKMLIPWGYTKGEPISEMRMMFVNNSSARLFRVLSFLGCKNVHLDAHPAELKEAKRAAKRHGGSPSDYRYHTLVVKPTSRSTVVQGSGESVGTMPFHKVVGHFARYGPEYGRGLLFGKLAGKFFIESHARGRKENGVVEKDYAIPA